MYLRYRIEELYLNVKRYVIFLNTEIFVECVRFSCFGSQTRRFRLALKALNTVHMFFLLAWPISARRTFRKRYVIRRVSGGSTVGEEIE
jgi:hypothetical protein